MREALPEPCPFGGPRFAASPRRADGRGEGPTRAPRAPRAVRSARASGSGERPPRTAPRGSAPPISAPLPRRPGAPVTRAPACARGALTTAPPALVRPVSCAPRLLCDGPWAAARAGAALVRPLAARRGAAGAALTRRRRRRCPDGGTSLSPAGRLGCVRRRRRRRPRGMERAPSRVR